MVYIFLSMKYMTINYIKYKLVYLIRVMDNINNICNNCYIINHIASLLI